MSDFPTSRDFPSARITVPSYTTGGTAGESKPVTNQPVGWTCPVCQRGVAPGVKACDHKPLMVTNQPHHPGNDGPF